MASYFSDPQELSQQDPHAFAEEATVDILAKIIVLLFEASGCAPCLPDT